VFHVLVVLFTVCMVGLGYAGLIHSGFRVDVLRVCGLEFVQGMCGFRWSLKGLGCLHRAFSSEIRIV